ncbi:hypothetical protein [Sphingomonas sp. PB4P5]|uniref:hypothetical protein n=1 Tax=Parasphingomonas puruogangriensis TaxID=3096155 RepID=UPI002FC7B8F1
MADADAGMKAAAELVPAGALHLQREVAQGGMARLGRIELASMSLEAMLGRDSLWLFVRRDGVGGYALRTAFSASGLTIVERVLGENGFVFRCDSAIGQQEVRIEVIDRVAPLLRASVTLTPPVPLVVRFWPRDLYPIGADDDPLAAQGHVEAAQRGLNAPIVLVARDEPGMGGLLYFQNLTALNGFYRATGTRPDSVVGGRWPQLGYQPPSGPQFQQADDNPLPADTPVTISDALLAFDTLEAGDPRQSAIAFLNMLGTIYPHIVRPATKYHDWPALAKTTARDLRRSAKATVEHYGHRYVRPYTAAEVPDSMVQLAVARPIARLAELDAQYRPLAADLLAGVSRFFDPELGAVRRFLPNVIARSRALDNEKDENEVDSWYLYHPLVNLAKLARAGDAMARTMLLDSVDFAIKVARHFRYRWPITFDVRTLKVHVLTRKEGDPGQSDVGGIYAQLMLDMWELTGKKRFLNEAIKGIEATRDRRFDLNYQTNLTAFGVSACLRLWHATGNRWFLEQSFVFLASFLHNTLFWESQLGAAAHYTTFMGATCLHDGPYMAIYECYESWEAFRHYLVEGRDDLPHSVKLLTAEFCRYGLQRAWSFYPAHLPDDIFPDEIRNGEIDRKLAFPLEDLYGAGDPPGQVGQEIYGCGAAFAFAAGAWRTLQTAPFSLFCDYPIAKIDERDDVVRFETVGVAGMECRLRLIAAPRRRAAVPRLSLLGSADISLRRTDRGDFEAIVPAATPLSLAWDVPAA